MVRINAGEYSPLFKGADGPRRIRVEAFWLDRHAVTNAQFAAFIRAEPRWAPDNIKPVFADDTYLDHWREHDPTAADGIGNQPVTNVSWFAARAYCKAQGKRLPTEDEWELAAAASETEPNGTDDAAFRARILEWYSKPAITRLPAVEDTWTNYWGVSGIHGVTWELVDDFNTALVSGESRGDAALENKLYCGAGAAAAIDPSDYAAFMRYAMRSSYRAKSTLRSLGFRCASDNKNQTVVSQ
ncbi:formylglycine-generating enzyme family protein [Marinihelvus fidelis]|uniref:Formylglycine-generating enzyme family protein n=2 Tax=Marinihelvus fidelis TaxID=2613842 RepID=A0A5N0TCV0_9GAMM|nr:formylglycine-generating enzyme family protein [Marinihelvus fidelis]